MYGESAVVEGKLSSYETMDWEINAKDFLCRETMAWRVGAIDAAWA